MIAFAWWQAFTPIHSSCKENAASPVPFEAYNVVDNSVVPVVSPATYTSKLERNYHILT